MNNKEITLLPRHTYHIYNRANGKENLFANRGNSKYFLELYAKKISPIASMFAYCLMPNHIHFAIQVKNIELIEAEWNPGKAVSTYFDETPLRRNQNPDTDEQGKLVLLANTENGTALAGARVEYRNIRNGTTYKGITNEKGLYRGPNQAKGILECTISLPDGSGTISFSMEIFDDNDPVHTLVIE